MSAQPKPTASPLFRLEAIEAAAGSQFGEQLRTHWNGVGMFMALAFMLVLALLVLSALIEYAPIHRIGASLDVRGGLVRLRSPEDGLVVERIAAVEGAVVHEGALLAVLGSERLRSDGGSQQAATRLRLQEERAAIEREIAAAQKEAAVQNLLIDQRLAGLRAELVDLRADLQSANELLLSLRHQSDLIAAVAADGFVSSIQAAQKRDAVTAQAGRVAAARAAVSRAERDSDLAQTERRLVDARLTGLVESRRRSMSELERLMLRSDAEAGRAIRAPTDATVSSAAIAQGQSVGLGQALFTLTPLRQPLTLRILVPTRAAASVKPGTDIKFVLQAYPQEKFGEFPARIESVSNAPAMPGDLADAGGSSEPVYMAVASLTNVPQGIDGRPLELKPGMLGEALVPIERRSVLEWLLEPILRGLRERGQRVPPPGTH